MTLRMLLYFVYKRWEPQVTLMPTHTALCGISFIRGCGTIQFDQNDTCAQEMHDQTECLQFEKTNSFTSVIVQEPHRTIHSLSTPQSRKVTPLFFSPHIFDGKLHVTSREILNVFTLKCWARSKECKAQKTTTVFPHKRPYIVLSPLFIQRVDWSSHKQCRL